MTTSMPTLDQLVARLKAIKASHISVTAYRSTTPEYAKEARHLRVSRARVTQVLKRLADKARESEAISAT